MNNQALDLHIQASRDDLIRIDTFLFINGWMETLLIEYLQNLFLDFTADFFSLFTEISYVFYCQLRIVQQLVLPC